MRLRAWPHHVPASGAASSEASLTRRRRLTFAEFCSRMEREFGISSSGSGLLLGGFQLRDKLEPSDIRWLCQQVGVPAEDFGIEA